MIQQTFEALLQYYDLTSYALLAPGGLLGAGSNISTHERIG